jgi:hypothetical protein
LLLPADVSFAGEDNGFYCNVAFDATDATGQSVGFYVRIFDISGDELKDYYNLLIDSRNSFSPEKKPIQQIRAGKTYYVTYSAAFQNTEAVYAPDGNLPSKFIEAEPGDMTISLVLDYIRPTEPLPSIQSGSDTSGALPTFGNVKTGNDEADDVLRAFLSKTQYMSTDANWIGFLAEMYDGVTGVTHAETYSEVTGDSSINFLKLTPYEKFAYYGTVLDIYAHAQPASKDFYLGSEENFTSQMVGYTYRTMHQSDPEVADAYRNIMMWQYGYYLENGAAYDFFTGKVYGATEVGEGPEESELALDEQNELEALYEELTGEMALAKSNLAIPIAIVIAAVLAFAFIMWKRGSSRWKRN